VDTAAPTGIGTWLRLRREQAGLTQAELAERAGLTASGIAALERGRRKRPYPHTLRALATALDLSDAERTDLLALVTEVAAGAVSTQPGPAPMPSGPPTALIGRDGAVNHVLHLLGGAARLVTLTGPGGVGKTSLALEAARRGTPAFPGGVAVVSLEALDKPAFLASWIAASLGLTGLAPGSEVEALHGFLDDRHLLLVLDNFEHLLAAAGEVASLVAAHPGLRVLVTSRAPLRVRGEREYPVEPLAVPALSHVPTPGELAASDAVRLFIERARAVSPSFDITQANATAIAAICRRLDGLPLALELAAARLRILSPTELLARLDQSLPLLTGGARDLPERQRTMRQTIEWSYRILAPEEQALFRRLSIFVGGWDAAAANAIAAGMEGTGPDILAELSALVEHSLVVADASGDVSRYRMLETIRAYGRDQLAASGELDKVSRDHALWYVTLAEQAATHYYGPEEADWLDRLEQDHPNLRAAVVHATRDPDSTLLLRLVAALGRLWLRREHFGDDQAWMARALRLARETAPSPAGATVLFNIGRLLWDRGETSDGIALLRESLDAWEALDDGKGACGAAITLANMLRLVGETSEAAALLNDARSRLDGREGESFWLSTSLRLLGIMALEREDWPNAEAYLIQALETARESGYPWSIASALHNLGDLVHRRGDHPRALALYQESLVISWEQRDRWSMAVTLPALAEAVAALGDGTRATRLFGAASGLRETIAARLVAAVPGMERHQRIIAALRGQLGEAAFEPAWNEGRSLTLEAVIGEVARAVAPRPQSSVAAPERPAGAFPAGLSLREIEVIRLVSAGLTNAQVADQLYLSRRTVDAHLRRIYDKLDLSSRAAIVRFAHEHNLLEVTTTPSFTIFS